MTANQKTKSEKPAPLAKAPTGIEGLDEITAGGLPAGRPTLISGSAGCGKTMLAMEFLVRGATQFDEPGVFMMFEESAAELTANVRSLGFDLDDLVARRPVSTISRASSSASGTRSIPSVRNAWYSTRWRRSSPACPIQAFSGPNCAAFSAG